jgi:AraC-like DNA-binding protein
MTFLSANYQRPLRLGAIADHVHASPSRLSHLFREQTGKTPMAFLENRRIQEASRLLLSTNMRVREVAEAVGFTNPYHFCVRFKSHTGMAPRDFRRPATGFSSPKTRTRASV